MNFISIQSFGNYIDANMIKSRLEDVGIPCWLKDEYTVTIDPILSNAIGGIKLMVRETDAKDALEILQLFDKKRKESFVCPNCGSNNIELVSSSRKAVNWVSAIVTWLFGNYAIAIEKAYHCFDCGHEFKEMPNEEVQE